MAGTERPPVFSVPVPAKSVINEDPAQNAGCQTPFAKRIQT
jgi:hypothetical protein